MVNNYDIISENSSHHWTPFNFIDKVVLDLGCGRWFGVDKPEEYSPIWFGENGSKMVIGVDESRNDFNFYKEHTKNSDKYHFICKRLDTTKDIEDILDIFNVTALKSDIEGFETLILDVNLKYFDKISDIAIEYHTKEIKESFIKKFEEWGFTLHTHGKFTFAGDNVGVLFGKK